MMVDGRRSLGCGGLDGSGIGDGARCDSALTRSLGVGCALTTKGDGSTSGPGCGCGLLNPHARRACVDAPSGARRIFGQLRRGIGCCHVSGLCCGGSQAAGPYGSSWIRSTSLKRARSALPSPGSPDPASPTFAPYLSFDLLPPSTASRPPTAYAATAGAR